MDVTVVDSPVILHSSPFSRRPSLSLIHAASPLTERDVFVDVKQNHYEMLLHNINVVLLCNVNSALHGR